jgi:hypothetical protein
MFHIDPEAVRRACVEAAMALALHPRAHDAGAAAVR